jgi:hypothetical protein
MRPRLDFALFATSVFAAALYAFYGPAPAIRGGGEMVAIAQNLVRTGTYGYPFVQTFDTGPTAVVPPLFPAYISVLLRFLGNSGAWMVLAAGVLLMQALHAILLPRMSRIVYGSPVPGICAATLCIILPVFSWMPYWDAVYTATALLLFCVAGERLFASGRTVAAIVLCPVGAGLVALMNPATLIVSICWILFLLDRHGWPWRRAARFCAQAGVVLLLVLLPWSLRNYARLGALTLRTNFGMTLYASNNDCATASMISELASGCYMANHPYGSLAEARLIKDMGEPAYDRNRVAAAVAWMRTHPARFAGLTAQRMADFWFPSAAYGISGISVGLVTLLSIPGFVLMRRSAHWKFFAAVFLVYPCLYYLVVSDYRYRYPILWLSLLPAGYAVSLALSRARQCTRHFNPVFAAPVPARTETEPERGRPHPGTASQSTLL